jgi:hypothetical protein
MTLSDIHAFGTVFDVKIAKVNGEKVAVTITKVGIAHTHIINDGETANIKL